MHEKTLQQDNLTWYWSLMTEVRFSLYNKKGRNDVMSCQTHPVNIVVTFILSFFKTGKRVFSLFNCNIWHRFRVEWITSQNPKSENQKPKFRIIFLSSAFVFFHQLRFQIVSRLRSSQRRRDAAEISQLIGRWVSQHFNGGRRFSSDGDRIQTVCWSQHQALVCVCWSSDGW